MRPGKTFVLELIDNLPKLAPVDNARFFHLDFDIGLAGESHDGHNRKRLKLFQDASQGTDMTGILKDRIIELILVTVDVLRPVLGVLPAVNPAIVVLGLDDEDAIYRHDKVVYLRTTFWCRYRHIVQHPVLVFRQMVQLPGDDLFSNLALRRDEPSEQGEEPNDKDDSDYEGC